MRVGSMRSVSVGDSLTLLVTFFMFLSAVAALQVLSTQQGLNATAIENVRGRLLESAHKSWELGTAAEALLELEWRGLSVYDKASLPPPHRLNRTNNASDVFTIINLALASRPQNISTLMEDGAVGDPASLGVAVLLANWTRPNPENRSLSTAAESELQYLLNIAPRASDGAISHRSEGVQLWSDFVYMVPPFLAYFGALQGGDAGKSLLQEAFHQISLYRDNLRDETSGLWMHIRQGTWEDKGLWATGNGWAAAGMLRVLKTIQNSEFQREMHSEQGNLTNWVSEIVNATWNHQQSSGSLRNYLSDDASFEDSSSTALLASATYRLAAITNDSTHIPSADRAFSLVQSRIDKDGWLQNVVDPYNFGNIGTTSPEGQAFILLLQASWRDYQHWANKTKI